MERFVHRRPDERSEKYPEATNRRARRATAAALRRARKQARRFQERIKRFQEQIKLCTA